MDHSCPRHVLAAVVLDREIAVRRMAAARYTSRKAVRQPGWRWFEAVPLRDKLPVCFGQDRNGQETSPETERHPHSKQMVYLVQNTRSDPVLDSSDSGYDV